MKLYDYVKGKPSFETRLAGTSSLRSHYEFSFSSSSQADFEEGNTVYADYFMPHNTRAPLLIISHGYGDVSLAPCLTLARLLVRNGIAAFVLYLPIHSRRLPANRQDKFIMADTRTWFEFNRRAIIEIRQVVDWAYTRDEIIRDKIGVAGISLGGMISAIAMAVDNRIKEGIFITTGGNLEELAWGEKGSGNQIGHSCSREECHYIYSQYPDYMLRVAEKGLDNVNPVKECFLIDPLTFASLLRERPVLMINGKDDEIVSERSTLSLWEACGKPSLKWIPGTHAGTYSQSTIICNKIVNFLSSF